MKISKAQNTLHYKPIAIQQAFANFAKPTERITVQIKGMDGITTYIRSTAKPDPFFLKMVQVNIMVWSKKPITMSSRLRWGATITFPRIPYIDMEKASLR
jgi:hypothetical protein